MPDIRFPWLPALGCAALFVASSHAQSDNGIFEGHGDIGTVLHPGAAEYVAGSRIWTISGSGENMWFGADAFQFVWKKVSGDLTLTADISFAAPGGNPHKKAVLMIRQSLDPDSPYADVALHGNGLTSLQYRDQKGANTHEVESNISGPARLRIEKRGADFLVSLGGREAELQVAAGAPRLALTGPFYVGLGVCAHDKDAVEKAIFSNVSLVTAVPESSRPVLYSVLETVTVASTDRRVTYLTAGRIESPLWSPDGTALLFVREGHVERIPVEGGKPEVTGLSPRAPRSESAWFNSDRGGTMQIWRTHPDGSGEEQVTSDEYTNWFPHLSPDRQRVVFLSFAQEIPGLAEDQDVLLRVKDLSDGKISILAKLIGGRGTMELPSWSPDSRRLAFVSYILKR